MVFMFAGRVNMRASPRTGGAFFHRSVYPRVDRREGEGGEIEWGWERESDEWKEGGREGGGDTATFESARQPTHFSQTRERTRNTEMPHMKTPRLAMATWWTNSSGRNPRVALSRDSSQVERRSGCSAKAAYSVQLDFNIFLVILE